MGFLKGLALTLIGILLFLSIMLFGAGLTFNFTALSPTFVNRQIDDLDVAAIIKDSILEISAGNDVPDALREFLDGELPNYSVELKAAIAEAVDRLYDYILGRTDTLDLNVVIGETILDPELFYSLADKIDWPDLAEELVKRKIGTELNPTLSYLADYVDDAMMELDPWFRQTLRRVVPPVHDYLLQLSPTLQVSVPLLEPAIVMYNTLYDIYTRFPPPELAGATPEERLAEFNNFFFFELIPDLPAAIEIDNTFFEGAPQSLTDGLAEIKVEIDRAKQNLVYYWLAFYSLGLFIIILVGLAFLIYRKAYKTLHFAGTVFFIFGLVGFVGVMVTNSMLNPGSVITSGMPSAVEFWLPGVIENALRPFLLFSIGMGALGLSGIVGSVLLHPHSTRPV
jgi:hypothetical protein